MDTNNPDFLEELTKDEREFFDKVDEFVKWAKQKDITIALIVGKDKKGGAFFVGETNHLIQTITNSLKKSEGVEEILLLAMNRHLKDVM